MGDEKQARLGELLIQEGLLNSLQLQKALQIQKESRLPHQLGEVLSDLGFVPRRRLATVLRKFRKGTLIGQMFVQASLLSEEQLEEALRQHGATGKRLGEVVVELGFASDERVSEVLSRQLNLPFIVPDARKVDRNIFRRVPPGFIQSQCVIPMFEKDGMVTVVGAEPLSDNEMEHLRSAVGGKVTFAIGPPVAIRRVIDKLLAEQSIIDFSIVVEEPTTLAEERLEITEQKALYVRSADQIKDVLDYILFDAHERRASDIHFEALEDKIRVRYRIDGVLVPKIDLPHKFLRPLLNRIKGISKMELLGLPRNQEGRLAARIAGLEVDIRVSVFNSLYGESVTMKLFSHDTDIVRLGRIGMPSRMLERFREILRYPSGVLFLTGASDSGKTTTLYASIDFLNDNTRKIVTMESPVERTLPNVMQSRIDQADEAALGIIFGEIIRQDPDVIVVGDVRGSSLARALMEAALSGHKIIATLNSEDAVSAIFRLMEMGLPPHELGSSLSFILSERLVRKVCPNCKESVVPEQSVTLRFPFRNFEPDDYDFISGRGCVDCTNTGFSGRVGIFELLTVNETIRHLIGEKAVGSAIRRTAREETAFVPLRADGFLKAIQGLTTLDEVLRVCPYTWDPGLEDTSVEDAQDILGTFTPEA